MSEQLLSAELNHLRRARAYLLRVAEPPAPALCAFIDAHGPVQAEALVRAQQVPDAVRHETHARHAHDLVYDDLSAAADIGARLVIPEDDEWPAPQLAALSVAVNTGNAWAGTPIALWTQSTVPLRQAFGRAVALVGARVPTSYGCQVAAEFGYALARDGISIVSGTGFGIAAEAHRGALAAAGMPVAVTATGIDVQYPRGEAGLLNEIQARGVFVSEYPPGTPPARARFHASARLIAALARATVVVEAGKRSGALTTARAAKTLGRTVMAVPGPITSAQSSGCHDLIRDRTAIVAASPDDVRP